MFRNTSWSTVKKYLPLFLLFYIPPIILLLVMVVIIGVTDYQVFDFFEDPSQIIGYDSYIGLVNNLGIILWAAAMTVCFFTCIALWKNGSGGDTPKFVLLSGILTLLLLVDDLFLIHEWLYRVSTEFITPVVFLVIFILLVFRFRKVILKTEYIFLILAIVLFGISLVMDVSQSLNINLFSGGVRGLIEESAKFLGIVSWLAYFGRVCLAALRSRDTG